MSRDLAKTFSYLSIHLIIGFSVAYMLTGSIAVAGGIALIEPLVNAVAFYFHERAWSRSAPRFNFMRDVIGHGHRSHTHAGHAA